MMALFVLENVRYCHIMMITINFGFVLGLMDDYNDVENYFPKNVKFHFFLSLLATCSVFLSALKMCESQTNGLTKPAVFSFPFLSRKKKISCDFSVCIGEKEWYSVSSLNRSLLGFVATYSCGAHMHQKLFFFPQSSQLQPGGL